jgi:ferritin-like metal-binding protein YciE
MTEEKFLELCRSKYEQLNKLNELKDFYEYEKQFEKIMTDLSRTVLQSNLSEVPADRRKKKHSVVSGK